MKPLTRRQLPGASVALGAASLLVLGNTTAVAADPPKVDPSGPQAEALSYVHDSPHADRNCANCRLYTGPADTAWGPALSSPASRSQPPAGAAPGLRKPEVARRKHIRYEDFTMENTLAWGVGLYLFVRIALFAVLGYWVYRTLRPGPAQARARSDEQSRYALERRRGAGRRG